ncbi:MAG: prolyl oligopeptidase family serine peptidase [Bacteroidetes bacterium]|nr:prolyl oligopeptidase family serine peptidase [Bacteroidota bacterium]MCH7770539.1 prolyl oligopeptidase family serine peptidase [Bacteroidota bacterium]
MSKSRSIIIERAPIELGDSQNKMIASGWGEDALNNTVVEKITYISDGLKVKGYIAYPKDITNKYPCVIWNRGGIGDRGAIDPFTAKGVFGQIASWGYVVFTSQYRGNDGGEGKDEFGGSDLNDVLNLIPLADEFDCTVIDKWGIEGWSRGGMMTYLALTKNNHPAYPAANFKCAIVTGGIANLRCNSDESPFMRRLYEVTMGTYSDDEFNQKCESRSIVNFPEKLSKNTPMLILHGTDDNRVLPHDSLDLSYQLLKYKIPFRLVMLEGGDHFMRKHRKEIDEMRRKWYEKYLQ